jgi:hypothetical protein
MQPKIAPHLGNNVPELAMTKEHPTMGAEQPTKWRAELVCCNGRQMNTRF